MNNWTIKELKNIDDISFAICILTGLQKRFNKNSPQALKLKAARNTLAGIQMKKEAAKPKTNFEHFRDALTIEDFFHKNGEEMKWIACKRCPADKHCQKLYVEMSGINCIERFRQWANSPFNPGE